MAPLLTCSARLPIYALLIAAVIPSQSYLGGLLNLQGLTLASLYLLGIFAAVVFAMVFKRTILRGQAPPFVMELPTYKWPSLRTVLFRMAERGWVFVRCAGTLILAVSVLVWAALYYPHNPHSSHQQQQRESYLGQAGQVIEPLVRPLGWDWRIGCAVLASFPAREIVVATMGVMYHFDDEAETDPDKAATPWSEQLRHVTWDGTDRLVFDVPVALSIMVFFALCASVCGHLGRNSARDQQLALAGVHLRLYDDVSVRGRAGDIPGGNVDRRLTEVAHEHYLARRADRRHYPNRRGLRRAPRGAIAATQSAARMWLLRRLPARAN